MPKLFRREILVPFIRAHWLALLVAICLNAIVLTNTIIHHPKIGYDVTDHLTYVQILPDRLPTQKDIPEYFSAPLAYFLPSLFNKACVYYQWPDCRGLDGKFWQILNFILSIGITVLFWKIAEGLSPGNEFLKVSLISMLGILTVYYRTFSQARSEPYVAFFWVLVIYLVFKQLQNLETITWKDGLKLGIALGLLILSRQWGFFIFPALFLLALLIYFKDKKAGWQFGRVLVISVFVAFIVGSWFYFHLYFSFGTFMAFNTASSGFSLSNHPLIFYIGTGLRNFALFTTPVEKHFSNMVLPTLYSDTWGDYYGYFTWVEKSEMHFIANSSDMIPYLGRVNLVSIFPSLILLAGLLGGAIILVRSIISKKLDPKQLFLAFVFLTIFVSGLGFFWFLVSYIYSDGFNNKATYMIQVFMSLPILAAVFMEKVRSKKRILYSLGMLLLLLAFAHNLPAMITRYPWK